MKKIVLLAAPCTTLPGCHMVDAVTDGLRHSNEVANDPRASLGIKPQVGFNVHNDTLIQVTVQFVSVPTGKTPQQMAGLSRHSIRAHFKQQAEHIVISHSLPG